MHILKKIGLLLIRIYQLFISPLLGQNKCKFHPTCSNYGAISLKKYGIFKGSYLTLTRIFRCSPFCTCGVDPVPRKFINRKVKL